MSELISSPALKEKAIPDVIPVQRLTALWALSESALGGVLHALHIPLTGLVIGSTAVVMITLIAMFSREKGAILRATFIVMAVKALVSPHTPINAYFAVLAQGAIGELLFRILRSPGRSAMLLGLIALFLSGIQKFLILTIVFGLTIWHSIDLFVNYIVTQMPVLGGAHANIPFSAAVISLYLLVHILAGAVAGWAAPRLGKRVISEYQSFDAVLDSFGYTEAPVATPKKKRKRWLKRLSAFFIFLVALATVALSYLTPVFEKEAGTAALFMIVRSLVIMGLWYFFIGPMVLKRFKRFLAKKQTVYADDVRLILDILPFMSRVVAKSWQLSRQYSGLKRLKKLSNILLMSVLLVPIENEMKE